jgi:hypothetical protein
MAGANHALGWLYADSLRLRHRVELAGGCNGRFERDAMIPKGLMSAENMGSQDLRTAE